MNARKNSRTPRVKVQAGEDEVLSHLADVPLREITPRNKINELCLRAFEVAERLGSDYTDATNIVTAVQMHNLTRALDIASGEDVKVLDKAISENKDTVSDPKKMAVMRYIYLNLRESAFPKE